jgi:uncharacterized surface protein with fasciclin (FAS1) repeats
LSWGNSGASGIACASTPSILVTAGTLTATLQGKNIVLKDEKGGTLTIMIANVFQSNGVIYAIDTVLTPN